MTQKCQIICQLQAGYYYRLYSNGSKICESKCVPLPSLIHTLKPRAIADL